MKKSFLKELRERIGMPPVGPKELKIVAEGDWDDYVLECNMHPKGATARILNEWIHYFIGEEHKRAMLSALLERNLAFEKPDAETIEWLEAALAGREPNAETKGSPFERLRMLLELLPPTPRSITFIAKASWKRYVLEEGLEPEWATTRILEEWEECLEDADNMEAMLMALLELNFSAEKPHAATIKELAAELGKPLEPVGLETAEQPTKEKTKDFFEELREELGDSPLTPEDAAGIAESEWEEFLEEGMSPAGAIMRFLCEWNATDMLKNPENKTAALSKLLELNRAAENPDAETIARLETLLKKEKR